MLVVFQLTIIYLLTGDLLLPLCDLIPDLDLGDLDRCLGERDLLSDLEYLSFLLTSGDLDLFLSPLFLCSGDLVFPLTGDGSLFFGF